MPGGKYARFALLRCHQMETLRCTLPVRRQRVQTYTRLGAPSTIARTRWMLGFQERLVAMWEWLTELPWSAFLPQTSHLYAMYHTSFDGSSHFTCKAKFILPPGKALGKAFCRNIHVHGCHTVFLISDNRQSQRRRGFTPRRQTDTQQEPIAKTPPQRSPALTKPA